MRNLFFREARPDTGEDLFFTRVHRPAVMSKFLGNPSQDASRKSLMPESSAEPNIKAIAQLTYPLKALVTALVGRYSDYS